MKNFIIGYGESITNTVKIDGGGGVKNHPYSVSEGRIRLAKHLQDVMPYIDGKTPKTCANDEVVVKFIQHPSYLAKSYYPKDFFKKFGMRDVGTKSLIVKPEKWGIKNPPQSGLASCVFVAGKKSAFKDMQEQVKNAQLSSATLEIVRTFESIEVFNVSEKIKPLAQESEVLSLEVVLHASESEAGIVKYFDDYVASFGGVSDSARAKVVGGLTFIPVAIPEGSEVNRPDFFGGGLI